MLTRILLQKHGFMKINKGKEMAREKILWNKGWKFLHGDWIAGMKPEFDDKKWYDICLPHSFGIPYFMENEFYVGYGCYRKHVTMKREWLGKRISLEFQGVFQEMELYVNEKKAGEHKGGYTAFVIDITNFMKPGDNLIFVRVNNLWNPRIAPRAGEHVFNGGIYRDVSIIVTEPVHISWYGTWVTTPEISRERAVIEIRTEVENQLLYDTKNTDTEYQLVSIIRFQGKEIGKAEENCFTENKGKLQKTEVLQRIQTENPHLWSPENPELYELESLLYEKDQLIDRCITEFGIRWFHFSANEGFFLNGSHYKIYGANVHQDHAGWADAVPRSGIQRDIQMIKECGMNFIRGSHYPHHTYFAEECDRQGILFWSENCFWGTGGPKEEGYWTASAYPVHEEDENAFEESCKNTLAEMIRTNRNHPSIIVWSMCNEPFFTDAGTDQKTRELLKQLVDLSHKLDPTRLAAIGGAQRGGFDVLGDIAGYNGDGAAIFHDPGFPNFVSEYGSTVSDRPGRYEPRYTDGVEADYPWRSGKSIWCGFHHGSILGDMGHMGMIDYYRLPLDTWYWYREKFKGIPAPAHAQRKKADQIILKADRNKIVCDGTEDIWLCVSLTDKEGKRVCGEDTVILSVVYGGVCFPTGWEYVMSEEKGNLADGLGAIELHACFPGKALIQAESESGIVAQLEVEVLDVTEGQSEEKCEKIKKTRENWNLLLPPPYLTEAPKREQLNQISMYRPVFFSSERVGNEARNIADGSEGTFWHCGDSEKPIQLEGTEYPHWLMLDLEGTKEIREINLAFEDMIYTKFAVALAEDRGNLKQVYVSDKRPVLTHLTLKMEEQSRYICLLLSDKEPSVRKMDVYA